MKNHYSIQPINVYIFKSLLYNNDSKELINCTIIGLCLYENETLCFDIILEDGSIFNYIPLDKIVYKKEYDSNITLKDLVYHNSPSIEISLNYIDSLKNMKLAYLKNLNQWIEIEDYILTIDWYKGNDLLNLVKLNNGFFALLPNHKIKMNNIKEFEKYSKIRESYTV